MRTIKQQIDDLGRDPLETWNVGYAHEWDAEIIAWEQVRDVLNRQADDNGYHIHPADIVQDAKVIAQWLRESRA